MKNISMIAAVFGLLSVLLGAFAAHGLKDILSEYSRSIWQTAVQYQMFHTLALLYLANLENSFNRRLAKITAYCFIIGTILFSGSLYLLALTGFKILGVITPIGGIAFVIGWIALVVISVADDSVGS
ncbi:MAG: DUF423 domain-containing protein [Kangiellaceae bacterium]|jgi:uncharacterized membrane protein YgdD (TMEM256/DUF423 family)|nr:DUF423 domain-containing protein [Kangiellaceae bacterium]